MEQATQYLYEYQDGKRTRNIGFMKIEKQMDKCLIQIYAKNMDDIQGILFQKGTGEKYMGGWEAEMLPVEEVIPRPKQPVMPQERENAPATPQERENAPVMPQEQENAPATSFEQSEAPIMQEQLGTIQEQNAVASETSEVDTYISPRNITFEKIQRQDLSKLPRKEWRLANNSFLLHGFYNYHHLLYIEEDEKIWIGVPGIYHEKEKMAANSFGFSEFRRLVDVQVDLEEDETNTYEDFGYWCRQIHVS